MVDFDVANGWHFRIGGSKITKSHNATIKKHQITRPPTYQIIVGNDEDCDPWAFSVAVVFDAEGEGDGHCDAGEDCQGCSHGGVAEQVEGVREKFGFLGCYRCEALGEKGVDAEVFGGSG